MLKRIYIVLLCLLAAVPNILASHIVGGEVVYKYLGTFSGRNRYQFKLVIYQDCINGSPTAIADDNPAFYALYNGNTRITNGQIELEPAETGLVPLNFSNDCIDRIPNVCLRRATFIVTFDLPPSSQPYTFVYQRCCRNGAINNVYNPAAQGATYYAQIPPTALAPRNTSATFKNYPPQIICVNNPLIYNHAATDADGDSLSYEFCDANLGASTDNTAPEVPPPPPYDPVSWVTPTYSAAQPIVGKPQITIDPVTGIITGTPNRVGRFLLAVCCHEWRNGVIINTVKREFQFVVTDCSKKVVACIPQLSTEPNTYIVECKSYKVDFQNCSSGGFSYFWDFGVAGATDDTSNAITPTFTYPDTGTYTVLLVVNPGSTCPDSITRLVKIYPYFEAKFIDSGLYCPNEPILFKDQSLSTIKPLQQWYWNFGDGFTSGDVNPRHSYKYGGTFNVLFAASNIKNCVDTYLRRVVIQQFVPDAGNDTIIVKGESVLFHADGGQYYQWSPPTYLDRDDIPTPTGYYPDTGKFNYVVEVESNYGCKGKDTVQVWVVSQATFYMPNAFSPNGDGTNDLYRPFSVGYKAIKNFRIYNRWGEMVYYSENLTDGWDGTYKGKTCDLGVYFWEITFIDRNGKDGYLKGDVTLVR